MSLATTGGGGAGLGGGAALSTAAMAHGGPSAQSIAAHHQQSHAHSSIPGGHGTAAPGTSYFALGADLLDKNQSFLNGKGVRSAAKLPLVAVDLYGDKCDVSYYPPMEKEEDDGGDEMVAMMKKMAKVKLGVVAKNVGGYSEEGTDVVLKRDDGDAYKAVKKYLTKGEGYGVVLDDALVANSTKDDDDGLIVIPRPHLMMGARQTKELNSAARATFSAILPDEEDSKSDSPAIDTDDNKSPLSAATIAMDGDSRPKGDDFDRVAFRMRLSSKKKVMTILPEEALALVIAKCKRTVKEGYLKSLQDETDGLTDVEEDEDEEDYMDYPPAFAIPGWANADATVEALIDAAKGNGTSCGPSLHQRSVAACVGALLPPPTPEIYKKKAASNGREVKNPTNPISKLAKLLTEVMQTKDGEAAREAAQAAAMNREDPVEPDPFVPLVVLVGATKEGIEMTAVQVSKPQKVDEELHCPFGNVSVISSVCHASDDPLNLFEGSLDKIREQIGVVVPESEEPTAFVTYGTIGTQVKLASKLKKVLAKYGSDGKGDDDWDGWDEEIPVVSTKEECVSLGTAILAASAHGRVRIVSHQKSKDGKMRARAKIGVAVQDVATCAVAVSFNYFGGKSGRWTEPKVIFDFDRRVPAGPYRIDFTAAECAAHIKHCEGTKARSVEDETTLDELMNGLKGSRGIPQREAAGLQLRFRIYQRTEREGGHVGWVRVGDDMRPLSMEHSQKDEGESGEENRVAIESAVLELSLSSVGLISTGLITNGETIVQATKSARNSKLLRYGGILGSVLFIGGFLVKSYVEERVFERDTQRVLAYYKHAAPNSFHDGDERHARYMVWKYKGKKDRLWRRLEAKYGVPVRHAWEWEDEEDEGGKKEGEEEAEDLDGDGSGGSEEKDDGGEEL